MVKEHLRALRVILLVSKAIWEVFLRGDMLVLDCQTWKEFELEKALHQLMFLDSILLIVERCSFLIW